jgi:hypothetical protein
MLVARKVFGLIVSGALAGALLAVMAPPTAALANPDPACKCDDTSTGNYSCNWEQTQCRAGSEVCTVICQ